MLEDEFGCGSEGSKLDETPDWVCCCRIFVSMLGCCKMLVDIIGGCICCCGILEDMLWGCKIPEDIIDSDGGICC